MNNDMVRVLEANGRIPYWQCSWKKKGNGGGVIKIILAFDGYAF